ncbi:hypothetical protein AB0C28_14730 [Nonomuraea sp. NPDC048892]|uniref:hypothetical protein n=1 Tax=Nonomuraea sp. NPDC048892 TaxID=3154624 RepID=UPI0033C0CBC6
MQDYASVRGYAELLVGVTGAAGAEVLWVRTAHEIAGGAYVSGMPVLVARTERRTADTACADGTRAMPVLLARAPVREAHRAADVAEVDDTNGAQGCRRYLLLAPVRTACRAARAAGAERAFDASPSRGSSFALGKAPLRDAESRAGVSLSR